MRSCFRFFALLVAALSSATCAAQVRDVRGYETKDSGLIGRASGAQQDIYWLDHDRIIFIGARPKEFVEPAPRVKEQRYGLFVWNLNTGAITRHHDKDIANGNLCVFRHYVHLTYTSDYQRSPVDQNWYVLEGPFGKETLVRIDEKTREERRNYERVLNRYTCREHKRSELPPLGYRVEPLLEGEFTSQEREPRRGEVVHWKYWPRNAPSMLLNITPEPVGIGRYSEYLDSYVLYGGSSSGVTFSDTVIRRSWLMDRSGRTRDFTPPTGPWMRGSTFVAPTKRGLFLISHAVYGGGDGAAGGYLMDRGELKRVVAGLPSSFDVSGDGCQVAIAVSQWRRNMTVTPWVKVINLCSKGG